MAAGTQTVEPLSPLSPSEVTFKGNVPGLRPVTLLDFWHWAFSDLCDDDIKGIFAEWMVSTLLEVTSPRRISWANSDVIYRGWNLEIKATSIWQSWKLIDARGNRKTSFPAPVNEATVRFCGLQARTSETVPSVLETRLFKSEVYVFCFQKESDPTCWDAWNLNQWEFYVMSRQELSEKNVGRSIRLSTLRKIQPAMSAAQFQSYMQNSFPTKQSEETN